MQAISRQDLESMNENLHKDFVLINVLPTEAFLKDHIRTSINIPAESNDFVEQVERVAGGKDRDIVVYCANFDCPVSTEAAKKLDDAGFPHVYDYEGGTEDWQKHHHH